MSAREKTAEQPKGLWATVREFALIVLIALLASWVLKTYVVRSFYIPSASMEQTLAVSDRIMVNQLPTGDPQRGDIIVFDDPGGWLPASVADAYRPNPVLEFIGLQPSDAGHQLIKRVIAVGGDEVACCDDAGRITVNGVGIDETYLASGAAPSLIEFEETVPAGHYWVMGDNRPNSADSRYMGESAGGPFVPEENVVGTVFVRIWPLDRLHWFTRPADVFADVPAPSAQ